jgi:hypothetical protein
MAKNFSRLWLLPILLLIFGPLAFYLLKGLTFSTRKLPDKNPATYVFHAPIAKVRTAVESSFPYPPQDDSLYGDWNPSRMSGRGSPETEFDLTQKGLTKSDVYHWLYSPLGYKAEFKLLLIPMSDSSTRVDVQTSQSMVRIGPTLFGDGGDSYERVAPTTIEEYGILLKIGRALNEPDMPPLKLPN